MLTTVASFMGIGALVLIPIAAGEDGRIRMPAWARTVLQVGGLAVGCVVVLSAEVGRGFFQLAPLPAEIVLTLAVIAGAWTSAVLHIHRTRIAQRAIDLLIAAWRAARPMESAAYA